MPLRLFDTYQRSLRDFEPINPDKVSLYACGPTVYDYAHIGNLRTYLFEDILRRALEFNGYRVEHVVNITDVGHLTSDGDTGEDKMEKGAQRTGLSAWEIAEKYTVAFKEDFARLNCLAPSQWCRATDHIGEQIDTIRQLEEKGFTYTTSDGVYFDTARQPDYGYLARLNIEGQQAGVRVDMAEKRNITDFALWKLSGTDQKRQMEWDSPWGVGFPGWHTECVAMSAKYLGPFFDIHCGGEDHITVHHTNEIAQAQGCHDTILANFWMHGYFLQLDAAKMSKSSGDFLRLQTLVDQGLDPLAYRFFCLGASYRAKLNFNWESLEGAATALERLRTASHQWGEAGTADATFIQRFTGHINEDLNTPRGLALAWELVRADLPDATKKATLLEFDRVLGLGLADWQPPVEEEAPAAVIEMAHKRQEARAAKDWALADSLRDEIAAAGFELEDTPEGPKVKAKSS
jgi:cysteinyl-tRNA synthetase